jgi:hypothetical protein
MDRLPIVATLSSCTTDSVGTLLLWLGTGAEWELQAEVIIKVAKRASSTSGLSRIVSLIFIIPSLFEG